MDMQGSRKLPVGRPQAWECLNDPQVLQACIPGCERMEADGENQWAVGLALKVGPVAARFAGRVSLGEVVPPERYVLSFEGQGGAAGFGKGQAHVTLVEVAAGEEAAAAEAVAGEAVEGASAAQVTPQAQCAAAACELRYTAHAQVGGKIAQVGQRLIDGVARSMAEEFFKRFEAQLKQRYAAPVAAAAPAEPPAAPAAKPGLVSRLWRGSGSGQ